MGFAAITIDAPFKNEHLSTSRIKQYEKCPLAFKLGYIDKRESWEEKAAADFGKVVHAAFQFIYEWINDEEFTGAVPDEVIIRSFRRAFEEAEGHVVGTATYQEGLDMVRAYFRIHKAVDHMTVLGVELPFTMTIESDDGEIIFKVTGVIDRVDRVGPGHIDVVDYKTNRFMFTREELDTDLQMSMYGIAIRALFPWATEVTFSFDMLRHNIRQRTRRNKEQLNRAADYVIAIGRRIETSLEFRANLNPLCPWCDHREACATYDQAVRNGENTLSYMMAADDIERVSEERERACALERIGKKRRKEMDRIILARIAHSESDALAVNEMRYKPVQTSNIEYPFHKTVKLLADALGVPEQHVMERVSSIAKGRMDKLISDAELGRGKRQLLKAQLETVAKRTAGGAWVKATEIVSRRA